MKKIQNSPIIESLSTQIKQGQAVHRSGVIDRGEISETDKQTKKLRTNKQTE